MGRKKKDKPKLELVWSYKPAPLMSSEAEEELKRLIREINGKVLSKGTKKDKPHTEHDPDLPPAA
jgi:hypothetical protein